MLSDATNASLYACLCVRVYAYVCMRLCLCVYTWSSFFSPVLALNLKPSLLLGSKVGLMILCLSSLCCERAGTFVIHTTLRDKHCFG